MYVSSALLTFIGALAVAPGSVWGYPHNSGEHHVHHDNYEPCYEDACIKDEYYDDDYYKDDRYRNEHHDKDYYKDVHHKDYPNKDHYNKDHDNKVYHVNEDHDKHKYPHQVVHYDGNKQPDIFIKEQSESSEKHHKESHVKELGKDHHGHPQGFEKHHTESYEKHEKKESVLAIDLGNDQHSYKPDFWQCAFNDAKVQKLIVPGWVRDCEVGGRVDVRAALTYTEARVAGIGNVDFYMDPCAGEYHDGHHCKSPEQQVQEFTSFVKETKIQTSRVWFKIETHDGPCKAWNYSKDKNLEVARQFIHAIRNTDLNWGIHADPEVWEHIFPGRDVGIDADDLPLWAPKFDNDRQLDVGFDRLMANWKLVDNKQYSNHVELPGCGGTVDLNSWSTG